MMRIVTGSTLLVLGLLVFSWPALTTHAQFPDIGGTASIKISPKFPEPGQTVTASVDAYSYDLTGASLAWFFDGTEQTDLANNRTITITAPSAGEQLALGMVATLASGQTLRLEKTIKTARVDIVIEADTVVPLFYKGRALPSSGSTIRAIALADTDAPSTDLSFTWRLNNQTLFGGPVRGRDVATFALPYGGNALLSVTVSQADGSTLAEKLIQIGTTEPQTLFYEDNPLRGLSRVALPNVHRLLAPEMTVRAEPYFMNRNIFTANHLIEWKIDGRTIDNPSDDPQTITLRNDGGTGQFQIDFHLRNLDNLLQGTREDFVVAF